MLVVADTSPLHYLVLIQHDAILPALYERVAIPPAVLADLQHSRTPEFVRAWAAHRPAWLELRRPRQALDARQFPRLGAGEREAIALAQELQAPLLLIDDADGRAEAERHNLTATGTLGILEAAAIHGLIDLAVALTRLEATTFRAWTGASQARQTLKGDVQTVRCCRIKWPCLNDQAQNSSLPT